MGLLDQKRLTVIVEDRSAKKVGFALVAFDGDVAEIELNGITILSHNATIRRLIRADAQAFAI